MLDSETLDIVTSQPEKKHSEFIRKSINFYNLHKDEKFDYKKPREVLNQEVEL